MSRVWKETISPKYLHDTTGVYHGWMKNMDRCWDSDDGFQVLSRLLITPWGKVEHATIQIRQGIDDEHFLSGNGEREISWAVKQEIKNELFGENRVAIEVYPKQKNLVDVCDVYHLWIFPKDFNLPFGIHPTKDPQSRIVNRGCPQNIQGLVENYTEIHNLKE